MGFVRLFKSRHVIFAQFEFDCFHSFLHVFEFRDPDDRRCHTFVKKPGNGQLSYRNTLFLSDCYRVFEDIEVFWSEETFGKKLI